MPQVGDGSFRLRDRTRTRPTVIQGLMAASLSDRAIRQIRHTGLFLSTSPRVAVRHGDFRNASGEPLLSPGLQDHVVGRPMACYLGNVRVVHPERFEPGCKLLLSRAVGPDG